MTKVDNTQATPGRDDDAEAELGPSPVKGGECEVEPETAPPVNQGATSTRTRDKRRILWIGGLVFVLVIIAVVIGVVYGVDDNESSDGSDSQATIVSFGQIVDIHTCEIYPGQVVVKGEHITEIIPSAEIQSRPMSEVDPRGTREGPEKRVHSFYRVLSTRMFTSNRRFSYQANLPVWPSRTGR
jgi:hypothetical protein